MIKKHPNSARKSSGWRNWHGVALAGFVAVGAGTQPARAEFNLFDRFFKAGSVTAKRPVTFTPPAGTPATDLRPQADAILDTAIERLAKATPKRPLIIVLGETHDISSHLVLHELILDRLAPLVKGAGKKLAFGYEWDHNWLSRAVSNATYGDVSSDLQQCFNIDDTKGTRAIKSLLAVHNFEDAPVAFKNLMMYLLKSGIPVRMDDAALGPDARGQIDTSDTTTRNAAQTMKLDPAEAINSNSAQGFALRNLVMARNALRHVADTGASVYILGTGGEHVLGNAAQDLAYDTSLYHNLRALGADVLPVLLASPNERKDIVLSDQASQALAQSGLVIEGLAETGFTYGKDSPAKEGEYIRKICRDSGGFKDCYNAAATASHPFFNEFRRAYKAWGAQAVKRMKAGMCNPG